MAVQRNEIEEALNELISYEEGGRFQSLAVVLAKQKWPQLIASERKRDLGLDAHAPAGLTPDGKGKGLACSVTAKLEKIKSDAKKISNNFPDVKILIFATSETVTNYTARKWSEEIRQEYGYELVVMSREDIITSLMIPANTVLCRTHLRIEVPLADATYVLVGKARDANREEVEHWLSHPRLLGKPLIALQTVKVDERGRKTEEGLDLASVQECLLKGRRIVLEGPAGAGKTTTLIQLAKQQSDEGRLGFIVDFPVWVRSRQDILEFIARMRSFRSRSVEPADLERLYTTEHFSFLLNGWNEISEVLSEEAVRALAELERSFPAAGIIIATRTHHIKPPLPGSFRLKLLALSRAQRNDYLKQALADRAIELVSQLEGNRSLDELTRTPFILSEVATLFASGIPIPTTKLGVLSAVMQRIEDTDEHRDHLQCPPLSALATDYLASLAFEMTAQGHVDISEEQARRIVSSASHALRDAGQIGAVPEPASVLNVLCGHHVLERLEYPSVAFRFQHQQFQEFYATSRLTRLLGGLVIDDNPDRIRDFQAEYLDKPMWGEPLCMIAEAIGAGSIKFDSGVDAIAVGKRLVEWSIPIDPIFAGELSRRCGSEVWREIRSALGARLRQWYGVDDEHHQQCALAGMLATGSEDFSDIILPLLTSDDTQVRLRTYRASGEFHVSSLGADWRNVVREWEEERRIEFIHDVTWKGGSEAADIAESFAVTDPSQRIKVEAIRALSWLGADDAVERLLGGLDEEAFAEALRHTLIVEELPPSLHSRAVATYHSLLDELTDVSSRLQVLIRAAEAADTGAPEQIKEELARMPSDRIRDNTELLVKAALDKVRTVDPEWVSHWVAIRIANGTLWREHWTELLTSVPDELLDNLFEKISTKELQHPEAERAISVLTAAGNDPLVAAVYSRLCTLRTKILESSRKESERLWKIYRQLEDLFRAFSPQMGASGISDFLAKEISLVQLLVVLDLFGGIGDEKFDIRSQLSNEPRQKLRTYLKNAVAVVLSQDDFNGSMKMRLALALARVGDPKDLADLHELIRSDIERVRKGREARSRGEQGPLANGAVMACDNWHVRAVAWLNLENADEVLLDVFNEPEYEIEAGWALVRLARKKVGEEERRHWVPNLSDIWEAREGRRESVFDEERRTRYVDAIKSRVHVLWEQRTGSEDPDSFNGRLKALAKILAHLDGRDSSELIMEILALPGEWDGWTRVEALEALLRSGAELPVDATLEILNPTIDHMLSQGLYNDQNSYLVKRCLCLLPYVDDPSKGADRIREILSQPGFPAHELRDVVTALGHSRSNEALTLLIELAGAVRGGLWLFARQWIEAVANLGLPGSKRTLLSFVDPEITEPRIELPDEYHSYELLASHIAALARAETEVRERIFQLCNTELPPNKRVIISNVIAQLGTHDAILAGLKLIRDGTSPPVPSDLRRGIETVLVERRPYGDRGYTYTLEPHSYNEIRTRLFEMVLSDEARSQAAFVLLGEIEVWRLDYGKPNTEPRHPAFETGEPWPPLETIGAAAAG